jgi:hypothetical protein
VDFPQSHFLGFAFQNGAAVRTAQRADESGCLKFDQKPPNHDGVCINRLSQTRRGTASVLLQRQDRHYMHRKSKSAASHAMNVTNLITFSKGYQRRGVSRRSSNRARACGRRRKHPVSPFFYGVTVGVAVGVTLAGGEGEAEGDGEADGEGEGVARISSHDQSSPV